MKRLIVIMLLSIISSSNAAESSAASPASLVVTTAIIKGSVNPLQNFVGTLYFDRQSNLASELEGVVKSIEFKEGEHLKKGDVLLHLDTQILQANMAAKNSEIKALQADVSRQERDLTRSQSLFDRNSISQSNYDSVYYTTEQLRAQLQAKTSELQAMNIQLEKTRIKAPFDCIVAARHTEVGEWVGKGATIATLIDTQSIEARLSVPAHLLGIIKNYKNFAATIEDQELNVTLKTVIPVADAATRTFPIEFNVPKNMGLIEGMRIDVKIPALKEEEALLVPRDAVIKRFGQTVLFASVDGKAVMVPVQVIGYETDMAAVAGDGLQEQMRVVIKGNERIFPNMPLAEKVQ